MDSEAARGSNVQSVVGGIVISLLGVTNLGGNGCKNGDAEHLLLKRIERHELACGQKR